MAAHPPLASLEDDGDHVPGHSADLEPSREAPDEPWLEEEPPSATRMRVPIAPILAVLAIAGWTALFVASLPTDTLVRFDPVRMVGWVGAWSVPVILVLLVWLIAIRISRREAGRFVSAAAALRTEAEALEMRLATVNGELSLARDFLANQARELDSLGRVAVERMSDHAGRLESLIAANAAELDRIESVGDTAVGNMERLRSDLPVIAGSARDMANQIGNAGRVANEQVDGLASGFERLNQFGEASERQVAALSERIETALAQYDAVARRVGGEVADRFETLAHRAGELRTIAETTETAAIEGLSARFDALADARDDEAERHAAHIAKLETDLRNAVERLTEIDRKALESSNAKLTALQEEAAGVDASLEQRDRLFVERVTQRRKRMAEDDAKAIDGLRTALSTIDEALAVRVSTYETTGSTLAEQVEAVGDRIDALSATMNQLAERGATVSDEFASGVAHVQSELDDGRQIMEATGGTVAELTEAVVRLLELIRGAAEHGRDELPKSLEQAEARLDGFSDRANSIRSALLDSENSGAAIENYLIETERRGEAAAENLAQLDTRFDEIGTRHAQTIGELLARFEELATRADTMSDQVASELANTIDGLRAALNQELAGFEDGATGKIAALSDEFGSRTAEALERAVSERATDAIVEIGRKANESASAGQDAVALLRDQLARVAELTANLESRVEHARERATEQSDDDFSRRVAIITESLNSAGIDIAQKLNADVSDTEWTAYLRGDRGIFTRRAVRLLDAVEARTIAETYDRDPDFRAVVGRYIADFEAMLRTMLSTRDGNALGVTLLSSDMGKLYVALAQAIERLRT